MVRLNHELVKLPIQNYLISQLARIHDTQRTERHHVIGILGDKSKLPPG